MTSYLNSTLVILLVPISALVGWIIYLSISSILKKNQYPTIRNHRGHSGNNPNARVQKQRQAPQLEGYTSKKPESLRESSSTEQWQGGLDEFATKIIQEIQSVSYLVQHQAGIARQEYQQVKEVNSALIGSLLNTAVQENMKQLSSQLKNQVSEQIEKRLQVLEQTANRRKAQASSDASTRAEKWILAMKTRIGDVQDLSRLSVIAAAIEQLDTGLDTYQATFEKLVLHMGEIFYRVTENLSNEWRGRFLGDIIEWGRRERFPLKFIVPQIGDGYDGSIHHTIDRREPKLGEAATVERVYCWGLAGRGVTNSVVSRARVELNIAS